jgi:hypothetical protein
MKLRIQGNSLRFRLTQKEVACLHDSGRVEAAFRFPRVVTYGTPLQTRPTRLKSV